MQKIGPVILTILDGWGVGPKDKTINAIEAARTPFFDYLLANKYPYTQLDATGEAVGLEKNQMSGSEAGHLNIGAGRIVKQDIRHILEAIDNGGFFHNPAFLSAIHKVKKRKTKLHLMGMMGNTDSPHSHPDIFLALLVLLKKHKLENQVFIHLFTDGRDSYPKSALQHLKNWKAMLEKVGIGEIATISGRFYAMDRVRNWDRLLKAYNALVNAKGEKSSSVEEAIRANYIKGNSDEYIEPTVIMKGDQPTAKISDGDGIIFFNFRSDRARQFSKLFVGENTKKDKTFPKIDHLEDLAFVAMTNFGPDLNLETAFYTQPIIHTLPVALSSKNRQLYISETEKYAHVTYFINGGYSDPIDDEERILISSPKVRSYAEKPEMSAKEIAEVIIKGVDNDKYDFITVNFPNADMVGHTGDINATIKGVEFIDKQLKRIYKEVCKKNGIMVITADHGNADLMLDKETGQVFTFHTKNPVPFILASENKAIKNLKLNQGILANIAPTVLELLDVYKPEEMKADSLIS